MEVLVARVLGGRVDALDELKPLGIPKGFADGVVFRRGRLVPWIGGILARLGGPAAAVTLGRTIVINPGVALTRSLLVHEMAHVRQWERDRWFPIRYALATLRHGYRQNPYEVEARLLAAADREQTTGEDTA